jgi:hypothetical protein
MVLKIIELPECIPANNFPEEKLLIQRHAHSQIGPDLRFVCRGQKLHPTSGRTI